MYSKMQNDSRSGFGKGRSERSRPRRITTTSPGSRCRSTLPPIRSRAQVSLATTQAPVEAAQDQGPKAVRIARRDQGVVTEHDHGEAALHPGERIDQSLLQTRLTGARQQVHHHLAVAAGAEDRAAAFELSANRPGVHQVSVVGEGDGASVRVRAEGLGVSEQTPPGGGIANVADRVTAGKLGEIPLVEHVRDETHGAVNGVLATLRGADSGALLPPVLERVEAQVGDFRGLRVPVDAENSALVLDPIPVALASQVTQCFHLPR